MKAKTWLMKSVCIGMVVLFTGCGTAGSDAEQSVNSTEVMQKAVEETGDTLAEAIGETKGENELVEAELMEEVQEPEIEVGVEKTMEEWLTEAGKQGTICMAVWNDANSTKHVIEEGERYQKEIGDRFFVCSPSRVLEAEYITASEFKLKKPFENYCEVMFGEHEGEDDISLIFKCETGEEAEVNFVMICDGETITSEPGFEWARGLGYETPKTVVWNDTTGFKQELNNGETYQLCEGDMFALFVPDNYLYFNSNIEQNKISLAFNIALINWEELDLSDGFDFEITFRHNETSEEITSHVTLLPMQ